MPDISMCANQSCPRKEDCYRFKATSSLHIQHFGSYAPDADGDCEGFWDNEKQQKANKL
jgi:hypothetical protein